MNSRPPLQKDKKPGKKVSVRKHLPLSVRVHYDTVRNFSAAKLAGLGVMAAMAVFGVFLSTQIASPQSFAAGSTIVLRQLENNYVEAVISDSEYSPRFVSHIVTDTSTCDEDLYNNEIQDGRGKYDPYSIFPDLENWDEREHYQGESDDDNWDDDNWETIWKADNNHEFRFLFPVLHGSESGFIGNKPVGRSSGEYLCMRVSYHDNNAEIYDYKNIHLLTLGEPTQDGASYNFTANREVHWLKEKASNDFYDTCEGAVSGSGTRSKTFAVETTEADHYDHFCIKARDANGIQAYKLIRVFPPKDEEQVTIEDDKEDTTPNFTVTVGQYIDINSNKIKVKASLFRPPLNTVISTWKYAVIDSAKVSIDQRSDCKPFFDSDSTKGTLVSAKAMVDGTVNRATVDIAVQYSDDWVCIQATDGGGASGYGHMRLPKQQDPAPEPEPVPEPAPEPEPGQQNDNPDDQDDQIQDDGESNSEQDDQDQNNEEDTGVAPPASRLLAEEASQEEEDTVAVVNQGGIGSDSDTEVAQNEQEDDSLIKTGLLDDQNNWTRFGGYILVAAAILGAARILIIKKYKNIDR